jgi:hypothetical protein
MIVHIHRSTTLLIAPFALFLATADMHRQIYYTDLNLRYMLRGLG